MTRSLNNNYANGRSLICHRIGAIGDRDASFPAVEGYQLIVLRELLLSCCTSYQLLTLESSISFSYQIIFDHIGN